MKGCRVGAIHDARIFEVPIFTQLHDWCILDNPEDEHTPSKLTIRQIDTRISLVGDSKEKDQVY